MRKIYVLDTNVLLENPHAIFSFDDNDVIIPEVVLEELDDFKKGREQINANAREFARKLQWLKESSKDGKSLLEGITLNNQGGKIYIKSANEEIDFPPTWESKKRDNSILKTCLTLMDEYEDKVVLITKDVFLQIKADDVGIFNEDYKHESVVSLEEQYTGKMDVYLTDGDFAEYIKNGSISTDAMYQVVTTDTTYEEIRKFAFYPNEFAIIHKASDSSSTVLGRVSKNKKWLQKLKFVNDHPYGITPRNASQIFIQEALMDSVSDTPLVIIKGPAGTAKTFYSLAVGLERIVEQTGSDSFRKMLVCRPYQTMEEDIGFLPGTEQEKILPMMRPIYDNLSILVDSDINSRDDIEENQDKIRELFDRQLIDMQAVGFLRGRSIERTWLILDEAQNMNATTAKAIATRAGEGTKIIISGDIEQIDNQYVTRKTNGLSYLAEKLKDSPLVSVITTDDCDIVRSPLAKEAVKYLD